MQTLQTVLALVQLAGVLSVAAQTVAAQAAGVDTLSAIRQRGVLVWGGDAEGGGPYVYPRDDDPTQVQGFEVELAALLAERLGVASRFAQGQWDKLPDLLQRGDIDIVLNGYEWKETWAERYCTSIPYYVYELQMLVRQGDPRFTQWDDLQRAPERKHRVAVLGGSAAETFLRSRFPTSTEAVLFDGNTDGMRAAELGIDGVDATLQDLPIVTFYERRFGGLRRLGDPVAPGYYVILARRDDAALIRALNAAILASCSPGHSRRHQRLHCPLQGHRRLLRDHRGGTQQAILYSRAEHGRCDRAGMPDGAVLPADELSPVDSCPPSGTPPGSGSDACWSCMIFISGSEPRMCCVESRSQSRTARSVRCWVRPAAARARCCGPSTASNRLTAAASALTIWN